MISNAQLERQGGIFTPTQRDASPSDTLLEDYFYLADGFELTFDYPTTIELLQVEPNAGAFADNPTVIVGGPWAAHTYGANWSQHLHVHVAPGTVLHPIPSTPASPSTRSSPPRSSGVTTAWDSRCSPWPRRTVGS